MMALASLVVMTAAIFATPFVTAYAMIWTDTGKIGGVIMMTAWLWTALYWGTMVHAKEIMKLFERLQNGKKD